MSILSEEERAALQSEFEGWMDCRALITHQDATTLTTKCSLFPHKGRVLGVDFSQFPAGREGLHVWKARFPVGTRIDSTCALSVTTPKGVTHELSILEVTRDYSLSTRVTVICVETADAQSGGAGTFSDLCSIWSLTDHGGGYFDLPAIRVGTTDAVPCNIAQASSAQDPGLPERLQAIGVNLRDYRVITVPVSVLTSYPGLAINWQITTATGTPAERRYNIVSTPDKDLTAPLLLRLECALMGAAR